MLLSGEAGIGKSRLLAALEERLTAQPQFRLRYFCSPHHTEGALYPVTARLEREAGFRPGDTAGDRLAKLEAVLTSTAPAPDDVALLAALLSIPTHERYPPLQLSPPRRKERTFAALTRRLASFARKGPGLVLFEDAHWSDPTSLELLDAIIERIPDLPLLLIASFRPDFAVPWFGRPGVSLVTLSRLDRRDATALAQQVVAESVLSSALLRRIVEQADGVPLFIEELTKAVLETAELGRASGATLAVPATSLADGAPRPAADGQAGRADRRRDRPGVLALPAFGRRRRSRAAVRARDREAGGVGSGVLPRHAARRGLCLQARAELDQRRACAMTSSCRPAGQTSDRVKRSPPGHPAGSERGSRPE